MNDPAVTGWTDALDQYRAKAARLATPQGVVDFIADIWADVLRDPEPTWTHTPYDLPDVDFLDGTEADRRADRDAQNRGIA